MHWYKRNIGDYSKKAGRLSMLQHGSYTLLIDACYDRERFPTLEEAIDWTWASTKEEIEAVEFVLRKFFTLEDGVYVQQRIKEELADYIEKAEKNKRIAEEREAIRRQKREERKRPATDRAQDVHEAPPNQEPVTNNQEPVTINKTDTHITREAQIAIELRRNGVMTNPSDPHLLAWVSELSVTDAEIAHAIATAKDALPGQRIGAKYLDGIIRNARARQSAKPKQKQPAGGDRYGDLKRFDHAAHATPDERIPWLKDGTGDV